MGSVLAGYGGVLLDVQGRFELRVISQLAAAPCGLSS